MLKHPSLHFLLEGHMIACNQVGAIKNITIPAAEKYHPDRFKLPAAGDWRCPV